MERERTEKITIRFSPWELRLIDRTAEDADTTRSAFLRQAGLDAAARRRERKEPQKEPR